MSLKGYTTPPKSLYTTPGNSPSKRLKTPEHKSPPHYSLLNQRKGHDGKKIGQIVNVDGDTLQERRQQITENYFPPKHEWEKIKDLKNIGILKKMQGETNAVLRNTDAKRAIKSHIVGQDPRQKEDQIKAYDEQNFDEQEEAGHFLGGKKRRNKKTKKNKKTRKSRKSRKSIKNKKTKRHCKKL
jgi:hypothetical protein